VDITIEYVLTGTGWSACTLDVYGQQCQVTASYLSDALLELISGVSHVLGKGTEARFSFDEEPGEYRWILKRLENDGLSLRILAFDELWGHQPDEEGEQIFDVTCPVRELSLALLNALNQILDEYGVEGYNDKWHQSEFPYDQYSALCELLGEPVSPKFKIDKRVKRPRHRS